MILSNDCVTLLKKFCSSLLMAYSNSFLRLKVSFALCDLAVYTVHYEIIGSINSAAFGTLASLWCVGATWWLLYFSRSCRVSTALEPVPAMYLSIEFLKQIKTFISSHFFQKQLENGAPFPKKL